MDSPEPKGSQQAFEAVHKYNQLFQTYLGTIDKTTPHTLRRWGATAALLVLFFIRILWAQAYYIVCYALGIYLLNLFLAFLQPKFDPALAAELEEKENDEATPGLPTSMPANGASSPGGSAYDELKDGEFRPFIRRLPEFKFWYSATKAIVLATWATLFPFFDIPVFWPILLVYFCVLFVITMRRQISHMRRYKYLPFDIGRKTQYSNGAATGRVAR
ncbi:retrieval of early ER protein Rer1 [Meredithblackwellia eburnea MCA 4105]